MRSSISSFLFKQRVPRTEIKMANIEREGESEWRILVLSCKNPFAFWFSPREWRMLDE
jgi:hypothetical protein